MPLLKTLCKVITVFMGSLSLTLFPFCNCVVRSKVEILELIETGTLKFIFGRLFYPSQALWRFACFALC